MIRVLGLAAAVVAVAPARVLTAASTYGGLAGGGWRWRDCGVRFGGGWGGRSGGGAPLFLFEAAIGGRRKGCASGNRGETAASTCGDCPGLWMVWGWWGLLGWGPAHPLGL